MQERSKPMSLIAQSASNSSDHLLDGRLFHTINITCYSTANLNPIIISAAPGVMARNTSWRSGVRAGSTTRCFILQQHMQERE